MDQRSAARWPGPSPEHVARFVRRLIAERRIEFVKVRRHVRISESALADFIDAGRVQPMPVAMVWPGMGPVA